VTDEFGEVKIPAHPQRVAGIYVEDYMMALGMKADRAVVSSELGEAGLSRIGRAAVRYYGQHRGAAGSESRCNHRDGGVDAAKYEMYSKIAPTYRLKEEILADPAKVLTTIGDLLGLPDKGESAVAQYKEKIADAKEKLSQAAKGETVAVIRLNVGDKTMA